MSKPKLLDTYREDKRELESYSFVITLFSNRIPWNYNSLFKPIDICLLSLYTPLVQRK